MGLLIKVNRKIKRHINKNVKPIHRSLHDSRRLRIAHAVETSNSELHADTYIIPYTPIIPNRADAL